MTWLRSLLGVSCDEPSLRAATSEDPLALPIECQSYGAAERICG